MTARPPRSLLSLVAVAVAVAAAAPACDDNLTHPVGPAPWEADAATPLACVPNLDGQIDAAELAPAVGVPITYLVSPAGQTRPVDLVGEVDPEGRRVWDWSADADDRAGVFEAAAAADRWYGDGFPADAIAVALDPSGAIEGVYRHDEATGTFWLLGVASTVADPPEGRTLWTYQPPVALYRFPLRPGDQWTAVADVSDGLVRGLPYASRDTYTIRVDGSGRLALPDLTFTQALRVRTDLVAQPAVGVATSRRQVSFLFECFGEVARATSLDGEATEDFDLAAEVRRLSL